MTIAPLKSVNAFKTAVGWCAFITEDGKSDEGGGRSICVVYADNMEECERRTAIIHAALVAAEEEKP